jgi:hypothetical protein
VTFSKAPDGPLAAVDFTFTDAAGPGRSLVVVSGDRAYQGWYARRTDMTAQPTWRA